MCYAVPRSLRDSFSPRKEAQHDSPSLCRHCFLFAPVARLLTNHFVCRRARVHIPAAFLLPVRTGEFRSLQPTSVAAYCVGGAHIVDYATILAFLAQKPRVCRRPVAFRVLRGGLGKQYCICFPGDF